MLEVALDRPGSAVNVVAVSGEGGELGGEADAAVQVRPPAPPGTTPPLPGTGTDVR